MKKPHKDFDVREYLRSLRREIKMQRQEVKRALENKKLGEAAQTQGGLEILEWVLDDLKYYAEHGEFR